MASKRRVSRLSGAVQGESYFLLLSSTCGLACALATWVHLDSFSAEA